MVVDYDFEGFTESLKDLYAELKKYFSPEDIEHIFSEDANIVSIGGLVAFIEEPLDLEFLFLASKSLYYAIRIIKDNFKDNSDYKKYLDAISKYWKI